MQQLAALVDDVTAAGYGFETAMDMSPRQLLASVHASARREKRRILHNAISHRASQADKRGWQKFTDEIER